MKRAPGRLAAAFAVLLMLSGPADLLAARWRGAEVLVAFRDGRQLRGELVAVKTEALVIQRFDTGVESVPVSEIKAVRLARRAKVWQGLLGGFVAGAVGGAVWGGLSADDDFGTAAGAFLGGLIASVPASLVGLAAGLGAGLDDEIELAGLPQADLDRVLARLSRHARAPEAFTARARPSATGGRGGRLLSSRYDRARFRLAWATGYRIGGPGYFFETLSGAFQFAEAVPPGEEGLHSFTSYSYSERPRLSVGRISLSYALTRRFAAEVELYVPDRLTGYRTGDPVFASSADGAEYADSLLIHDRMSAVSLLAGLSFRPLLPAFLSPHSVELGVAAGPAWTSWTARSLANDPDFYGDQSRRTTAWTARVGASYDYRFAPSFSMGLRADYTWLRGQIPSFSRTGRMTFRASSNYEGPTLTRLTEVTIPGRAVALGGLSVGLRFAVGF